MSKNNQALKNKTKQNMTVDFKTNTKLGVFKQVFKVQVALDYGILFSMFLRNL